MTLLPLATLYLASGHRLRRQAERLSKLQNVSVLAARDRWTTTLSARQLSFVSQTVITASWSSSSVRRGSEVVGFDRVCMDSRTIHALLPALWYSASKAGFTCQSYQFQYRPPASQSSLAALNGLPPPVRVRGITGMDGSIRA